MSNLHIAFEEHDLYGIKNYQFFGDRIELDWQECGRTGKVVYPANDIDEVMGERTTFAHDTLRTSIKSILFLAAGLALHLGFSYSALDWLGFGFYMISILFGILLVTKIRKDTWLYLYKKDGTMLLYFREAGLRGITREELASAVRSAHANG